MAWGGITRSAAAVTAAAALLAAGAGCAREIDRAHSVQTELGRIAAVADVEVDATTADRGARIEVALGAGLDDAAVVALVAAVDRVASTHAYPSYRLDLTEPGTGDVLVVDDTFAEDRRAPAVVSAWRRTASAFIGDTTVTYEGRRTTVRVVSEGGMAHDVAESSRLAPPPRPVSWRYESSVATVVLAGRVTPADVALVARVQRGVVSPSLPVAARTWRLERQRTLAELDLRADVGSAAAGDLTAAVWGDRLGPLARTAVAALGRPRPRVVLRLSRPVDDGSDVFGWWTSDRAPAEGRDRLRRGWDEWLVQQSSSL